MHFTDTKPSPFPMTDEELQRRMKSAKKLSNEQFQKRIKEIKQQKNR